jgi:TIGR03009 family protein
MRKPVFALAVLLATAAGARSQQTPPIKVISPAPPAIPATNKPLALDDHLNSWESKMRAVQSLKADINRTDKNKNFGSTSKYSGYALYAKSGTGPTALNMAALQLTQEKKTEFAEKIVCTGTYLYQYRPSQKEINVYPIAKSKPGQVGEDSFLGFLFGMKAEDAKKQYNLTLYKVDANYVYIDVSPKTAAGKADFTRARMVLDKTTYMPRQLWFEEANGNEITWDIPRLQVGADIDRRAFDTPRTPPGWRLVPVASTAAPRVIRK